MGHSRGWSLGLCRGLWLACACVACGSAAWPPWATPPPPGATAATPVAALVVAATIAAGFAAAAAPEVDGAEAGMYVSLVRRWWLPPPAAPATPPDTDAGWWWTCRPVVATDKDRGARDGGGAEGRGSGSCDAGWWRSDSGTATAAAVCTTGITTLTIGMSSAGRDDGRCGWWGLRPSTEEASTPGPWWWRMPIVGVSSSPAAEAVGPKN